LDSATFYLKVKRNILSKENWLCFIAGLCLVFSYSPFSLWWLALFLPAILFSLIDNQEIKKVTKLSFIFTFGWFLSGISWVHVSIEQFGGLPIVISILLIIMLCFYLCLYPTLACYLATRLSTNKKLNLWLIPSFWLFTEYLRSVVLTGFPWLSLGYSQINSPLISFAPVIGEVGITALILTLNIAIYKIFKVLILSKIFFKSQKSNNSKTSLVISVFFIFIIAISTLILEKIEWTKLTGKMVKVALIQGNIKQSLKWDPEQEWPTMLKYLDLTRVNYNADLIIWPESAVPILEPSAQEYLAMVNKSAMLNDSVIITGIQNYNIETKRYFNGLIVLGKKHKDDKIGYYYNSSNRYYKHHLLPIGEFVPFQSLLRPIAPLFNLPMSSFSRGNYVQKNLKANELSILPLICFEIAFPNQLAANMTEQTELLLTVSNDAWFGSSHGPHQHMEIAQMRAVEFGRPLLRSTNNGVTAVVNHKGKIIAQAEQFKERVLTSNVHLVKGDTFYSQWLHFILWLIILLPLVTASLFKGALEKPAIE